jgi:hypothetical protein
MVGIPKLEPRTAQSMRAPRRTPGRTWAGRGTGAQCDLCHRIIDAEQVEYEVELAEPPNRIITMHLDCYERWSISREAFGSLDEEL